MLLHLHDHVSVTMTTGLCRPADNSSEWYELLDLSLSTGFFSIPDMLIVEELGLFDGMLCWNIGYRWLCFKKAKLSSVLIQGIKKWLSYYETASLHFWFEFLQISLHKFVRMAGELVPPPLFVPYINMVTGLSCSEICSIYSFNLLKTNSKWKDS